MLASIAIGIAIGLVIGTFTARASANRDPIYGGGAAKLLHYITASLATSTAFAVFASFFIVDNRWLSLPIVLIMLVLMYTSATIFATIERPAREQALAQKASQGWTEEDARTSGL